MSARILRAGSRLADNYRLLQRLHRSNHYDVFDAWDEDRLCRCAVKVPRPDRRDDRAAIRRLTREGHRLCTLRHPHLIRGVAVVREPVPFVVTETLSGETLSHMIAVSAKPTPAPSVAWLGLHLVSALSYLHRNDVLHLDLKPSNVVAEHGRAVVIDLGSASPPGRVPAGRGTWCYMAPEQVRGGDVGTAADVWGLGMVLFETFTGTPAITGNRRARPTGWRAPRIASASSRRRPLAALIESCLAHAPEDRPLMADLADALSSVAGVEFPPRPGR